MAPAARRCSRTASTRLWGARLFGGPQQALCRRFHHRALRQSGLGVACHPGRTQPRALHERATTGKGSALCAGRRRHRRPGGCTAACTETISDHSRLLRNKAAANPLLSEVTGIGSPCSLPIPRGFFPNPLREEKGPLASDASGPSLGRKRPRRAAIARGATAPQQYATALHKVQVLSKSFPP